MILIRAFFALTIGLATVGPASAAGAEDAVLTEIVVSGHRHARPRLEYAGNIERIDADDIGWTAHEHIAEILDQASGVWIVRGSGQEHQTAIRSPVLGGPGSCGGFLILEDGIPTRPAGFCNTNQLIEVYAEQARAIEVTRGPGNALSGSNALHGIVNVLMPDPGDPALAGVGLEVGSDDYLRAHALLPFAAGAPWLAAVNVADDGGFREDSGYRQGKLHVKRAWPRSDGRFVLAATVTDLRQETAGFIVGEDAYEDEQLSRTNPDPDAYRDATSARVTGALTTTVGRFELDVRPYLRQSSMAFLHHSLPGQPVERNGQSSAGLLTSATLTTGRARSTFGIDADWSDVFLEQTQYGPATGSPAQRETRPEGKHYDYRVEALNLATFVQSEYALGERWSLSGGLRLEYAHYDYDNRMLAGNTRDDGSACGFGGCLYTRPEDRSDSFRNASANAALRYRAGEHSTLFLRAARGFRSPQTLELYRLQNGQEIADLDAEHIDSLEAGARSVGTRFVADLSVFFMRKRDSTFRDANGFNVSGARSRHRGIEADVDLELAPAWSLAANVSYARHKYDFDFSGRGQSYVSGRDVDTAPRWLGGLGLRYAPSGAWEAGLRVARVGEYYLDPENEHRYPGHTLVDLRAAIRLRPNLSLMLKLDNALDTRYAERADYAGRDYRYLPGRGRAFFAELRFTPTAPAD
jgi:outer membrane receptor protein involved in Fe transport